LVFSHWHCLGEREAPVRLQNIQIVQGANAKDNQMKVVLLAEDSEDDAFFFQRAFNKACVGCSLIRAENGKTAIEILNSCATNGESLPFLIFLDLKMPVMSGFDVLEWLKASRIEPKPKVLVLSGSNDHADQMRALALGAAEYLVKPITPEVLSQRISDELNSSGEGESAGATA
jgi:CheY-like chemotaxis protein